MRKKQSFTLIELIVVLIILGILSTLALPAFQRTHERALTKEAISNLKLVAAAEKIYKMEAAYYYPFTSPEGDVADINNWLKLFLPGETNWDYTITSTGSPPDTFTATANRTSGSYSSCEYSIDNTQDDDPTPVVPGDCP